MAYGEVVRIMKKGGFTLIEMLLVFGIIAILAAMMMPMFNFSRYSAKEVKATHDFDAIKAAAHRVYFDTKEWPSYGVGEYSSGDGIVNANGITNVNDWHGPYINAWEIDPWGNAYVILQTVLNGPQWVSSKGPDSTINTSDDLILLLHP